MACRGVWNLCVNGKWYRYGDSASPISPPGNISTLRKLNQLLDNPDIKGWKKVTSPSLDLSNMDFIYTLDTDAGTFKISLGGRFTRPPLAVLTDVYLKPATLREGHDMDLRYTVLGYSHFAPQKYTTVDELDLQRLNLKRLHLKFGIPTAMNELQERIFADFFFRWDEYLDPPDWGYMNRDFRSLSMSLLRFAAWDFEVTSGPRPAMGSAELEKWQYPESELFWFHRFLVVIHEDIRSESMKSIAILKARMMGDWCSKSLLLLTSSSAAWYSPGFRALSKVLSSNYQAPIEDTAANLEQWRIALSFEILQMILVLCEPRDAVSFAQASIAVEKCYYTSIPQFKDLAVQEYVSSIPCCGKPDGLHVRGLCCAECYAWQHVECVGLLHWPSDIQHICSKCQEKEPLDPSLVLRKSRRYRWRDWPVHNGRSAMALRHGCYVGGKIAGYIISFNGMFSGMSYVLETIRDMDCDGRSFGRIRGRR
ncbi:hypothetical protein BDV27DRAFT_140053 [Aspergillus caelatus]|uniref:Uncharacterized protein n=1 Tax=Aspergillus caelatus TaxID=61420 RepID=A0A5N7ALR9_9EURO|nr:uncharacterized protein BDV27DRAFT_140053 [Aspergillus caelatus]KAE8370807.1 hypothetical protein BDV27DRAFT_140053 [Aspergillus caelatus]